MVVVLIMAVIIGLRTMNFRWSQTKFERKHSDYQVVPEFRDTPVKNITLRSIHTGDPEKRSVVFLHGSPGSIKDFEHYYKDVQLRTSANIIGIDRPGFGYSNLGVAMKSIV